MPKASEVATELRKLADVLDAHGETNVGKPDLRFWAGSDKEQFLAAVSVLPRPLAKRYTGTGEYDSFYVEHKTPALIVAAQAYRTTVCRLVTPAQPAVFECEPLLAAEEEEGLTIS